MVSHANGTCHDGFLCLRVEAKLSYVAGEARGYEGRLVAQRTQEGKSCVMNLILVGVMWKHVCYSQLKS
jgi:hypothetical protein